MRKIRIKPLKFKNLPVVFTDARSLEWQLYLQARHDNHAAEHFKNHKHEYFQRMLDNLQNPNFLKE